MIILEHHPSQDKPKEANINMPSHNHQTFYTFPHYTSHAFTSIGLFATSYALLSGNTWAYAGIIRRFEIGYIILTYFWVTIFNPETAWTTKKHVGRDIESGEGSFVKVKWPFVGFKACEYRVKTPEALGNDWIHGIQHEKAFAFEMGRVDLLLSVGVVSVRLLL